MSYPNTTMGRLIRAEHERAQDEANGFHDGKAGTQPVQPHNEHYMRAWREGRRDAEAAREGSK